MNLNKDKLRRWVSKYWAKMYLKDEYNVTVEYTTKIDKQRIFNFYVLIEIYVINKLREAGISFSKINEARGEVVNNYFPRLKYPFSNSNVINNLHIEREHLCLDFEGRTHELCKYGQLVPNEIINHLSKKIQFDTNSGMPTEFIPKEEFPDIIINPSVKFGSLVVRGTRISPRNFYLDNKAGSTAEELAEIYHINTDFVEQAIMYYDSE